MRCPNCVEEIRDTAKVCGYCGTRLASPVAAVSDLESEVVTSVDDVEQPEPATPQDSGLRRLLAFVIGGAVIAAVVGAVLVESGGEDGPNDTVPDLTVGSTDIGDIPVLGTWRAIDEDGSTMWLFIDRTSDPSRVDVVLYREGVAVCGDRSVAVLVEAEATYVDIDGQLVLDRGDVFCLLESGEELIGTVVRSAFQYLPGSGDFVDGLVDLESMVEYNPATGSRETVIQR